MLLVRGTGNRKESLARQFEPSLTAGISEDKIEVPTSNSFAKHGRLITPNIDENRKMADSQLGSRADI